MALRPRRASDQGCGLYYRLYSLMPRAAAVHGHGFPVDFVTCTACDTMQIAQSLSSLEMTCGHAKARHQLNKLAQLIKVTISWTWFWYLERYYENICWRFFRFVTMHSSDKQHSVSLFQFELEYKVIRSELNRISHFLPSRIVTSVRQSGNRWTVTSDVKLAAVSRILSSSRSYKKFPTRCHWLRFSLSLLLTLMPVCCRSKSHVQLFKYQLSTD